MNQINVWIDEGMNEMNERMKWMKKMKLMNEWMIGGMHEWINDMNEWVKEKKN